MAQFQYTAVNAAGKKLGGVIGAASEDEARKQLNTFGISVLAIQKIAETGEKTVTEEPALTAELPKFEFEAFDKTGRKVLGTIPASNRYTAFKRLMDEYQFEVSYVVSVGATPEEKSKAKQEDLSALKAEYEAQLKKEGAKGEAEEAAPEEFERRRQALLKKVDFILEKIKKLLAVYANEIKPESRKLIEDAIDKLLRIKSSTNLDYIEFTSEELLKKVQDQEIFLNKEKMETDRDHLLLETKQMMASLHERPTLPKDITEDLEVLQEKLAGSENKFLKGLSQWVARFVPRPEEKDLKNKIRTLSRQIWTYRKIWFTSPKSTKQEAWESLHGLINEKNRLKQELKLLKRQRRTASKEAAEEVVVEPLITEEVTHFLGWLLAFYLIAYFFSHYLLAKVFPGGNPLPGDFNLLASGTLRTLLISIFLWYILLQLRVSYLRYKAWANLLVIPVGLLLNASLVFNF